MRYKTSQEKKTANQYFLVNIDAKILNKITRKPNPAKYTKDYTP